MFATGIAAGCLLLLLLLLPSAATAGASAGGAWDIGDGDANADSFMYACTHAIRIAQHRESHPLQNDKELGKTTTPGSIAKVNSFCKNNLT